MENTEQNEIEISKRLQVIEDELKDFEILIRVNNLLMSKFILQISNLTKEYNLPKRVTFFRFELLKEDYDSLIEEFGEQETDRALYRLDRLLIQNKQQCPNNIRKYIRNRLIKRRSDMRAKEKQDGEA